MINPILLDYITKYCEGMDLNSIWDYFGNYTDFGRSMHNYVQFQDRREAFFVMIKELVEHNYIRLAEMGKPECLLTGTIDQQLNVLRNAFPKDDDGMHEGLWCFFDSCPVGCRWYSELPDIVPIPFV